MVYKCSVPFCRGNYAGGPRVHVFSFPADPALQKKWIHAIKRGNFVPTKHSKVCELHFNFSEIEKEAFQFDERTGVRVSAPLKIPRLIKGAVPSKIPGGPTYLSGKPSCSRESADDRLQRKENDQLQQAILKSCDSKKVEDGRNSFNTLNEFKCCLKNNGYNDKMDIIWQSNSVVIGNFTVSISPSFKYCVFVNDNMQLSAFYQGSEIKNVSNIKFPLALSNIHQLDDILEKLESFEFENNKNVNDILSLIDSLFEKLENVIDENKKGVVHFMKEQLALSSVNKFHARYSPHLLCFASILNSISPHAYKFLRNSGYLILPHHVTLYNICSSLNVNVFQEQQEENFLSYIKRKFTTLNSHEHIVTLMMDEIHLKAFYDYKGGQISGQAYDSEHAASSAYAFMIRSLLSQYQDVAHILPVKSFTSESLFVIIKKVIIGLEKIGFRVVCIVSDNNSINRKAMSFFAHKPQLSIVYPHPVEPTRPLFFVIDTVHLLKCIRNNWIGQKNDGQCMYYPEFDSACGKYLPASFLTIKQLHELEYNNLVKYGYGLTLKALWPSNLEKQNVKLVLQIFNNWIINALPELGKKHNLLNCDSTSRYIDIIYKWWTIVNVKTPYKGQHHRDPYSYPLTFSDSDGSADYLEKFLNWLNKWKNGNFSSGCLSRETHNALFHSTHALLELGKYCIDELKMAYFLPGKIQTDPLENRFGKYRQLSGSNYCISIRQLYESESKLRLQSVLPLQLISNSFGTITVNGIDNDDDFPIQSLVSIDEFNITVNNVDIANAEPVIPILKYLAGYCAYSALKKKKCNSCKANSVMDKKLNLNNDQYDFIRKLDRGGLLYPLSHVVNIVLYNYIVVQKLLSEELGNKFLK